MLAPQRLSPLLLVVVAACTPSGGAQLDQYSVELREKINTCRELDPQVAFETLFVTRHGSEGVLHLGGELAFPVRLAEGQIAGEFLETDHTTVVGRHVVCKRVTRIELQLEGNKVSGIYERQRRQECLLEAKPCQTTWTVTGKRREGT